MCKSVFRGAFIARNCLLSNFLGWKKNVFRGAFHFDNRNAIWITFKSWRSCISSKTSIFHILVSDSEQS